MSPRTKIVATIGPASGDLNTILSFTKAGMTVARFNCAHGSWNERAERVALVRQASQMLGKPIAVLFDLAGPKARLGKLPKSPRTLAPGERVTLVMGAGLDLPLPVPPLFAACRQGSRLLLGDGYVELRVMTCENDRMTARVVYGGPVSSHMGVTLVGTALDLPAVTQKDKEDLSAALELEADFIGLSYVRSHQDIDRLRTLVSTRPTPIIAKIETREAVLDLDAILDVSDGVMVARGDLGLQLPLSDVPGIQKRIIRHANARSKPAITATQMLESMVQNSRPTRAEASDVANAIWDGTDAVMLSGETAAGRNPLQSVKIMAQIARAADKTRTKDRFDRVCRDATEAVALGACRLAHAIDADAILTATASGHTPRMVAAFRPSMPVVAVTSNESVYRQLALVWGVLPTLMEPMRDTEHIADTAIAAAKRLKVVRGGDKVVLTAGVPINVPGNTNLILVRDVE